MKLLWIFLLVSFEVFASGPKAPLYIHEAEGVDAQGQPCTLRWGKADTFMVQSSYPLSKYVIQVPMQLEGSGRFLQDDVHIYFSATVDDRNIEAKRSYEGPADEFYTNNKKNEHFHIMASHDLSTVTEGQFAKLVGVPSHEENVFVCNVQYSEK